MSRDPAPPLSEEFLLREANQRLRAALSELTALSWWERLTRLDDIVKRELDR